MLSNLVHVVTFFLVSFSAGYLLFSLENFFFEEQLGKSAQIVFNETALSGAASIFARCSVSKCLDLNRCLLDPDRSLKVAVQPLYDVVNEKGILLNAKPSREFLELRRVVKNSVYYEKNEELACLIIPGVDTLSLIIDENGEYGQEAVMFHVLEFLTSVLPNGSNLVYFSFVDNFNQFQAREKLQYPFISARTRFHRSSYRQSFDISISPMRPYNLSNFGLALTSSIDKSGKTQHRSVLVILWGVSDAIKAQYLQIFGSQKWMNQELETELDITFLLDCNDTLPASSSLLSFQSICAESKDKSEYLDLLKQFDFVTVSDQTVDFDFIMLDVLEMGEAVLAIISDNYLPPFHEIVDWSTFSLTFARVLTPEIPKILLQFLPANFQSFRTKGKSVYKQYFSSLQKITLTTFSILESRIIPGVTNKWSMDEDDDHCGVQKFVLHPAESSSPTDRISVIIFLRKSEYTPSVATISTHITVLLTSVVEAVGRRLNKIFIIRRIEAGHEDRVEDIDIPNASGAIDLNVIQFADLIEVPQALAIVHKYASDWMIMIDGDTTRSTDKELNAFKACLKNWSNKPHAIAILEKSNNDSNSINKIEFPVALISPSHHKEMLDVFAEQIWTNKGDVCELQKILIESSMSFCLFANHPHP